MSDIVEILTDLAHEIDKPVVLAAATTIKHLRARVAELERLSDSAVFHQLCCGGGCHESMAALARLAKAIKFESDPATGEEIDAALKAAPEHGKPHEQFAEERKQAQASAVKAALERALSAVPLFPKVINYNCDRSQEWNDGYREAVEDAREEITALITTPPAQQERQW